MKKEIWTPFEMFCPNCAEHLYAVRNEEGRVKVQCPRCGVKYVSQLKGRRHEQIDMYAPAGQVATY